MVALDHARFEVEHDMQVPLRGEGREPLRHGAEEVVQENLLEGWELACKQGVCTRESQERFRRRLQALEVFEGLLQSPRVVLRASGRQKGCLESALDEGEGGPQFVGRLGREAPLQLDQSPQAVQETIDLRRQGAQLTQHQRFIKALGPRRSGDILKPPHHRAHRAEPRPDARPEQEAREHQEDDSSGGGLLAKLPVGLFESSKGLHEQHFDERTRGKVRILGVPDPLRRVEDPALGTPHRDAP